jgi:PEGA domain
VRFPPLRLLAPVGALALAGCAALTPPPLATVTIDTQPAGATVLAPDGQRCTTPCALDLSRDRDWRLRVQHEGYQPVDVTVRSVQGGAEARPVAGNLVLGGQLGRGIDAATGATRRLEPAAISLVLEPRGAPTTIPVPALPEGR